MHPLTFLQASLFPLPSSAHSPSHPHPSSPACKAVPGSANWPSTAKWAALNESLDGRLLKPSPPGAVCHPERPEYDAAACAAVKEDWVLVDWYATEPIGAAWSNWDNDSCVPFLPAPCSAGGYPVYVVNATCAEDVKKGVDFAREENVRLVVKASGHDYLGRSSAPNSLSIWTHSLTGACISFSKDFKPSGCDFSIEGDAITFGAGFYMAQLNAAAAERNLTIISGGEGSVNYGGYSSGAGHGALSPTYGLAADQILELEVVTPGGDIVRANECQNKDLFWALRGGGGGTFGVVTETTTKAFPSAPFITAILRIGTLPESEPFWDAMTYFLSQFPSFASQKIGNYGAISPNATLGNQSYGGYQGIFFIPAILPTNTSDSLVAAVNATVQSITNTWPGLFEYSLTSETFPQFNDFFVALNGPLSAGTDQMVGSRLLDAKALSADLPALKKTLKTMPKSGWNPYLLSGDGVRNAIPRGGSNSVNPAWRRSLVHCTLGVQWPALSPAAQAAAESVLTNTYVQALRELAPDTGAYVNEADANEPNFQETFWGENYARLKEIKRRIDPGDVFWCSPCVGNEGWEVVDGGGLCRVGKK